MIDFIKLDMIKLLQNVNMLVCKKVHFITNFVNLPCAMSPDLCDFVSSFTSPRGVISNLWIGSLKSSSKIGCTTVDLFNRIHILEETYLCFCVASFIAKL